MAVRRSGSGLPAEEGPEEKSHIFMKKADGDNHSPTEIHQCRRFSLYSRKDRPPSVCALVGGRDVCGPSVQRDVSGCVVHIRIQTSSHSLQHINLYLNDSPGLCWGAGSR